MHLLLGRPHEPSNRPSSRPSLSEVETGGHGSSSSRQYRTSKREAPSKMPVLLRRHAPTGYHKYIYIYIYCGRVRICPKTSPFPVELRHLHNAFCIFQPIVMGEGINASHVYLAWLCDLHSSTTVETLNGGIRTIFTGKNSMPP